MPTCEEIYIGIHSQCQDILTETFKEGLAGIHSKSHNYIGDLSLWIAVLEQRPEVILLKSALKEYQFGLIAVTLGLYRQAFMALRLFVEQSFAAVHFSGNEFQLRLWMQGQQDIFWQSLIDHDNGIFSKKFVGAFNPQLVEESFVYREMARTVYRECSEFSHGNFITQVTLPEKLEFSKDIFEGWHDKAETACLVVMFGLCVRYLCFFDAGQRTSVESSIMEHLGYVSTIRAFYDVQE